MRYTFITSTRCPIMAEPACGCNQTDEMLMGWRAEILEQAAPGWVKVRTDYRYEGYAPLNCLCNSVEEAHRFAHLPKKVITKGYCTVLSVPDVRGACVADLTMGALIAPIGLAREDGWIKVALPDGRMGYTKQGYLGIHHESCPYSEDKLRQAVCDTALKYMGTHYRWGGKSPLGIDCSGLTFMAYWLNGVSIYRDARILPDFPVRQIPRSEMKKGDLLFFPGHVALYLGDGRYIHSTGKNGSDGVVINSLDPSSPDYRSTLDHTMTAVGTVF